MTLLADLELPIFAYELLETVASVDIYKNSKKIPQLWQLWIEFYHSVFVEFLGSLSKIYQLTRQKKICVDGVKKKK